MAELYRYAAFISYSSKDAAFARRLHRALESYGIPSSLGKFELIGGGKKNRIYPVFRDREELSAGHLGDQIEANLKASAALIVVCSPNGAASPWVQKEIEFFAAQGRHSKIFAIIPDSAPLMDEQGADCTQSCFPPAFRGDALAGDKLEPLAADARKGKDGFRNAWLKIVAGMIGVTPGQIIDRDKRRRRQQRLTMGTAAAAVTLVAGYAVVWSQTQAWRNDFAVEATRLLRDDQPTLAMPFAVAGAPARGAAVPISGAGVVQALRDHRFVGLRGDLGLRSFPFELTGEMTSDCLALSSDGYVRIYDFDRPTQMLRIPIEDIVATDNGEAFIHRDAAGRGTFHDLRNGCRSFDVGPIPALHNAELELVRATAFLLALEGGARKLVTLAAGTAQSIDLAPEDYFETGGDGETSSVLVFAQDGSIRFYDVRRQTPVMQVSGPNAAETSPIVMMSDDGNVLVIGGVGTEWVYYNWRNGPQRNALTNVPDIARVEGTIRVRVGEVWGAAHGLFDQIWLSPTGSLLAMQAVDGRVVTFDLNNAGRRREPAQFSIEPRRTFVVSGDRLITGTPGGELLVVGGAATVSLPAIQNITLVGGGAGLIAAGVDGRSTLIDLGREMAPINLGELRAGNSENAENGSLLALALRDGSAFFYDFSTGGDPVRIPQVEQFRAAGDGALVQSAIDRHWRYLDLRRGRDPVELGSIDADTVRISQNGAALLARVHGAPDRASGQMWDPMAQQGAPFRAFDLAQHAEHIEIPSPPAGMRPFLTGDGSGVVTLDARGRGAIYTFANTIRALGRFAVIVPLEGGARMLAQREDSGILVYDLAATPVPESASGAHLVQAFCDANGYTMSPLPRSAQGRVGRPFNPCDWRGLFAIFPDSQRGDGWFEGARQWMRFVSVRYFGMPDWECAETTSRAAETIREARANLCVQSARRDADEASPTDSSP